MLEYCSVNYRLYINRKADSIQLHFYSENVNILCFRLFCEIVLLESLPLRILSFEICPFCYGWPSKQKFTYDNICKYPQAKPTSIFIYLYICCFLEKELVLISLHKELKFLSGAFSVPLLPQPKKLLSVI